MTHPTLSDTDRTKAKTLGRDPAATTTAKSASGEAAKIYALRLVRAIEARTGFASQQVVVVVDESVEAAGYRAMNDENLAVHADFAEASFRSLPVD